MERLDQDEQIAVGYGGQGAMLLLRQASDQEVYLHHSDDRFWKIAINIPNLDLAHEQLASRGITAANPYQFKEIAYMSHLKNPEGHIIELIQHSFEDNPRTSNGDATKPLGGGAEIGLIALRTDNIDAEKLLFLDKLKMAHLSRQEVTDRGFDLYFFAMTSETQPSPDVDSVENREWLWQRPYTTLEFQHRLDGPRILPNDSRKIGSATIVIEHADGTHTAFR